MKKVFILLFIFVCFFALTGCKSSPPVLEEFEIIITMSFFSAHSQSYVYKIKVISSNEIQILGGDHFGSIWVDGIEVPFDDPEINEEYILKLSDKQCREINRLVRNVTSRSTPFLRNDQVAEDCGTIKVVVDGKVYYSLFEWLDTFCKLEYYLDRDYRYGIDPNLVRLVWYIIDLSPVEIYK